MTLNSYILLDFLHILLFAYWLGTDWGVFVNGRRVADESLSREERLRFLKAAVAIDIFPRSSIVLLIAVGLTLASMSGNLPLGPLMITLIWIVALIWLLLVWLTGYILSPGPLKGLFDKIHLTVRHIVTCCLLGVGVYSLIFNTPIINAWLAVKFVLVAALIAVGSVLRLIMSGWVRDLTDMPGAEGTISRSYGYTRKLVVSFWMVSIFIAFLGVTKPF